MTDSRAQVLKCQIKATLNVFLFVEEKWTLNKFIPHATMSLLNNI